MVESILLMTNLNFLCEYMPWKVVESLHLHLRSNKTIRVDFFNATIAVNSETSRYCLRELLGR